MDVKKEESESKSGVMPKWRLFMPQLILEPEHFMLNDNPRNYIKEQLEQRSEEHNAAEGQTSTSNGKTN